MTRVSRHPATIACATGLFAALLAAPVASHAADVTVAFSITSTDRSATGGTDAYPVGTTGLGTFTFDDTLMPVGGTGQIGNVILGVPTVALSFQWFGASFDVANASIATLRFTDGVLTDWSLGGRYAAPICGLSRYGCLHSAGTQPDFLLSTETGGGSLNDGVNAGLGLGYGTLTWSLQAAPVPEPAAPALLALGLACIGWRHRRAAASRA